MSWGLCRSCSGLFGQQLHWRARPHAVHRAPALRAFASKKNKSGGRPSLQDVENISRGDAAKSRGTGSRQVPHRLNAEERKLYDLAKQKASQLECATSSLADLESEVLADCRGI